MNAAKIAAMYDAMYAAMYAAATIAPRRRGRRGRAWRLIAAVAMALVCVAVPVRAPVHAEMTEPFRAEHAERLTVLFARLAASETAPDAYAVEREIWDEWFAYGDEEVEDLMSLALQARQTQDFERAEMLLSGIVGLAPDYAEAWNQRATIRYMAADHDGSLDDIAKVLALEPRHFGALAGKAAILAARDDKAGAIAALETAIEAHPFLRGRRMLEHLTEVDSPPPADADNDADDPDPAQ